MLSLSIEQFSDRVPLVDANTSMMDAVQMMVRTRTSLVVVQDVQGQPVGALSLSGLLPCLLPSAEGNWASGSNALSVLASCVLEPIKLVPNHWSLERVYQAVQGADNCHWLLINGDGLCLGVLNQKRWWEYWAGQTVGVLPQRRLPEAIAPLEAVAVGSTLSLTLLEPLLEHLPLPLMVLSANGQVLLQNAIWRHQLARVQDAEAVWKKVSAFLVGDPLSWAKAGGDSHLPDVGDSILDDGSLHAVQADDQDWEVLLQCTNRLQETGSCQKIPNSSTCVCLCGMEEAGDRVWQFCGTFLGYSTSPLMSSNALSVRLSETQNGSQEASVWLILAQDVTEQQQVAKELAAKNADLVQLNRLKDEFLACISHELRTPLTAVLGLSNLLKDQMIGSLNDRQERYAQLIYQSGRHLMSIVNDILDLTRIETGQLELSMVSLSVEAVCLRALAQARQAHGADGVDTDLEVTKPPHTPDFSLEIQPDVGSIVADELRLRQMLSNLLSNALKFTDDTGQIGLRVEEWDGWVAFTVWDTGIGIPQNQQSLIFQKFQQLEHPLTRRFEGTGLGLVLTQRLAWLHGGDVTFTSTEGQGSQFTLLLPPDPSLRGVKPRPLERRWHGGAGHHLVLLVEGVPQYLDDLQQQLSQLGYRVAIARSGTEALKKARQLQPLMIFLNPLLSQLSGWDVLTLLRSHSETHKIPIVITASRSERGKAFSQGASSFLSLPIQPDVLRQTIEGILAQMAPEPEDVLQVEQLTILHLRPAIATIPDLPLAFAVHEMSDSGQSEVPIAHPLPVLADLLQPYPCRVLEVDDLDQADLLARVWKPHLILLDGVLPKPLPYLRHLNRYPALAALPLITLSPENTQAAHQMQELSVFPCLEPLKMPVQMQNRGDWSDRPDISPLLRVMRQATGSRRSLGSGTGPEEIQCEPGCTS